MPPPSIEIPAPKSSTEGVPAPHSPLIAPSPTTSSHIGSASSESPAAAAASASTTTKKDDPKK